MTSTCSDQRELALLLRPMYRQGALYIPSHYAIEGVTGLFDLHLVLGNQTTILKCKARRVDPFAYGLTTGGYPGFALFLSELDTAGKAFVAELTRSMDGTLPLGMPSASMGKNGSNEQDRILCHVEFKEIAEPAAPAQPAPARPMPVILPRAQAPQIDESPEESTVIVGDDFAFMEEEADAPNVEEVEEYEDEGDDFDEDEDEEVERTVVTSGGELFGSMLDSEEATAIGELPPLPMDTPRVAAPAARPARVATPMPATPMPAPAPPPVLTPAAMLTPAPMTPAPMTPAPMTPAPMTPAPMTPAPQSAPNNPNYAANSPNYGNDPNYNQNDPSRNPNYNQNNPNYNQNYNEMPSSIVFGAGDGQSPNTGTQSVNAPRSANRSLVIAAVALIIIVAGAGAGYYLWSTKDGQSVVASKGSEDAGPPPSSEDASVDPIPTDANTPLAIADASTAVAVGPQPDALPEGSCEVSIITEPDGAALIYQGTNLGLSPYKGPIACDAKVVEIRHPQYEDAEATFEIVDGKASAAVVQLKRPSFWVTINSVPDNATLRLDGEVIGKTPFSFPLPGFEWTSITISHKGFAAEIIDVLPTEYKSAINIELRRN